MSRKFKIFNIFKIFSIFKLFKVSNMKIGAKLAAMSGIGILLVAVMAVLNLMSERTASKAFDEAARGQATAQGALSAKHTFAIVALAGRDLRYASTPDAVKKRRKRSKRVAVFSCSRPTRCSRSCFLPRNGLA